jgi:dipeptidyl-peptidase II
VVTIEHRFFGPSNPAIGTEASSELLTMENIMLDSVSFIEHIQNTVPGAKHSKAIIFGGSYAGFVTTVTKVNHPDTFFGAMPHAAPLRSIGANYQNLGRYAWYTWVSKCLVTLSEQY